VRKKFRRAKHCFRFKVPGQRELLESWAKVKDARFPVQLTVTPEDVRNSMKLNGVGNTRTCTMALCAKRSEAQFAHPVEGYIDWQYRTCFVVTKLKDGWPSECVAYAHDNQIAHLNDSKGGQKILLAKLEAEGPITVRLRPIGLKRRKAKARYSKEHDPNRGWQPKDIGVRKSTPAIVAPRGAAARFAFAKDAGAFEMFEENDLQ
jgi:hypothetical protein